MSATVFFIFEPDNNIDLDINGDSVFSLLFGPLSQCLTEEEVEWFRSFSVNLSDRNKFLAKETVPQKYPIRRLTELISRVQFRLETNPNPSPMERKLGEELQTLQFKFEKLATANQMFYIGVA